MNKRLLLFLAFCLLFLPRVQAKALVERSPMLDVAFSALEKDNLFLRRYNELTGANVEPLFELGVPYYFGGKANSLFLARYPEYSIGRPWENSNYFSMEQTYIYGLDCSGFTQWILRQCRMPAHDNLTNMILLWEYQADGHHLFNQRAGHEMPPYAELKDHLSVGDLFVVKHQNSQYRHIMMYIGTLRDYGITAEEEPALADYLDYPLVIHCGNSPVHGERFQRFIDEHPDAFGHCTTTDGGVQVSILGVPLEDAPCHAHVQQTDYDYFLMDQGHLVMTTLNVFDITSYCWFRM